MKVIDARSGKELVTVLPCPHTGRFPGMDVFARGAEPTVDHGDGEGVAILAIEAGYLSARACLRTTYRDHTTGRLRTSEAWVPLSVRWTHPSFMLQHVAFIPS